MQVRPGSTLLRVMGRNAFWLATLFAAACTPPARDRFEVRDVVQRRLAQAEQQATREESLDRTLAEVMVTQLRISRDPAMRSSLAHKLGDLEQDWIIPELLVCLSKEQAEGTRIEIARALARNKNWAGLDALYLLAKNGTREPIRTRASQVLDELARHAGQPDSDALWRLWNFGDMDEKLPFTEPSARYRLEIWKRIAQLGHGEDADAFFVLSNSQAWVAAPLAAALHDEDELLAARAARCLQGLGGRGNIAGPDLVLALETPRIATEAAAALGRVAYPAAGPELVRCLTPKHELDLRLAAAHSLGQLGLPATIPALESLLKESEPRPLRSAAATALIKMGTGDMAIRSALSLLREGGDTTAEVEQALGAWLKRQVKLGDEAARIALDQWNQPTAPPGLKPTPAERDARLKGRVGAIEKLLAQSAQD